VSYSDRDWKVREAAEDAHHAIWQDPSSYDPLLHGPPYLPTLDRGKTASAAESRGPLAELLTLLQALALMHQAHHWATRGESSYGDHLLFERLYNDIVPEIDAIAERATWKSGPSTLDLTSWMLANSLPQAMEFLSSPSETRPAQASLTAEIRFTQRMGELTEALKVAGGLTRGVDNLLAGIEDTHEKHLYLLNQRMLDPWKATDSNL
jgi:DNA-binding ferritin-like protein